MALVDSKIPSLAVVVMMLLGLAIQPNSAAAQAPGCSAELTEIAKILKVDPAKLANNFIRISCARARGNTLVATRTMINAYASKAVKKSNLESKYCVNHLMNVARITGMSKSRSATSNAVLFCKRAKLNTVLAARNFTRDFITKFERDRAKNKHLVAPDMKKSCPFQVRKAVVSLKIYPKKNELRESCRRNKGYPAAALRETLDKYVDSKKNIPPKPRRLRSN